MRKPALIALAVTAVLVCILLLVPAPQLSGPSTGGSPLPPATTAIPTTQTPTTQVPTTNIPFPTIPTTVPTIPTEPTVRPTIPTTLPTAKPTTKPTSKPTAKPTTKPTQPTTKPTTKPTVPDVMLPDYVLESTYAFVYDGLEERMLFQQGLPNTKVYPASITKVFSCLVALQYMDPDTVVTVGKEVDLIDPDSSRAKVYEGNQLTVKMLVQAMLLPSGNDAAYALAAATGYELAGTREITPKQAVERFVEEMNTQAKALGLTGSRWANPDGIHSKNHYTTPADLIKIASLAMENELIRETASLQQVKVTFVSGQTRTWKSTNLLLDPGSKYYAPEAVGLKTGYTGSAGNCLLSAFKKGDNFVFICVLKAPSSTARFADTYALYEHYIKEN